MRDDAPDFSGMPSLDRRAIRVLQRDGDVFSQHRAEVGQQSDLVASLIRRGSDDPHQDPIDVILDNLVLMVKDMISKNWKIKRMWINM